MTFWNVKLYDNGGNEQETIRHLADVRKDELMHIFDRLGVQAQAMKYNDEGSYVEGESVNWSDPVVATRDRVGENQAERLGVLWGTALANFDTLGEFQAALGNAMSGRSYNWDVDELEEVLEYFITHDIDENPPMPHPRSDQQ